MDLAGDWRALMHEDREERIPGPELGEFFGIPINDSARWRAELRDASIQSLPEWQCRPHGADYITRGPSPPRIWKEVDPVSRRITANHAEWLRSVDRPIYTDGRRHPPENAAHTWAGYSTGRWVGVVLKVTTTHLKEDYVRRSGLPRSDKATMTEFLIRNGDYLTWVTITHDPIHLEEPLIRTSDHSLQLRQQVPPYPCGVVQEVDRPNGYVPHHFPGENPYPGEAAKVYGIPYEATMGGAATIPARRPTRSAATGPLATSTASRSRAATWQEPSTTRAKAPRYGPMKRCSFNCSIATLSSTCCRRTPITAAAPSPAISSTATACAWCIRRPPKPTVRRSCTSTAPMSSSPATFSPSPAIR